MTTGQSVPDVDMVEEVEAAPAEAEEPADGYWLVTVDGQRIASREPWEVRGRRILYTNAAGDLVSVRASEIDLDASQRLTFPPPAPKTPATAAEPREAVLVPFARETIWYDAAPIQRRAREVQQAIGHEEFLEAIAVVSLANAICRLSVVAD